MSDEAKGGAIKDAADAVKGIVEAVPIYQDLAQPAVKELGTALQTVAKTVHIALAPVSALVWGYEQIREFVSTTVAAKLQGIPPEDIVAPKPNVAGPALEALKYTGHEESLREMYANLLAASMNKAAADGVHPAFVEIIRQLTPDEARVLPVIREAGASSLIDVRRGYKNGSQFSVVIRLFGLLGWEAGCERPLSLGTYIDNLCRLGLTHVPEDGYLNDIAKYAPLEEHELVKNWKTAIESNADHLGKIQRRTVQMTTLGLQFCDVCLPAYPSKPAPAPS